MGGAALALRYFDRGTTQDLDSLHIQPGSDEAVAAAAARVADRRGWNATWLNFAVEQADAIPAFGRRAVEWESIYDHDGIVIQANGASQMVGYGIDDETPDRAESEQALAALATLF